MQNGVARRLLANSKVTPDGCRIWLGKPNSYGYGRMHFDGKPRYVHRLAFEVWVGPITAESIDHLCGNRLCIEPTHLDQVSLAENTRRGCDKQRKQACPAGHEFTEDNTYRRPGTQWRYCRTCHREREQRRHAQIQIDNLPACAAVS